MFPIDQNTEKQARQAVETMVPVEEVGRSLQFDFQKKQFVFVNGKAEEVDKEKAVKQWLETMCRTLPNRYLIYGKTGFGIDTDKIIGYKALPKGFLYSEIQREIKENAVLNRSIRNITQFSAKEENGKLRIAFTALLYEGEGVEVNVIL